MPYSLCQAFLQNKPETIFGVINCGQFGYDKNMETGSYLLITRGMTVRGTDGDLGTVAEVVADAGVDIFRGIVLAYGFLGTKHAFVPAQNVVSVEQNIVRVGLSKSEAEQLPPPTNGGQTYEGRNELL